MTIRQMLQGAIVSAGLAVFAIAAGPALASNISGGGGSGGSATPGGSNGQLQYNNTGAFGGFTLAGDCTLSQPNIACAKTNGVAFTSAATTAIGTSGATIPLLSANNSWSGIQSHGAGDLVVSGATSGALTINCAAVCGASTITLPAGTTDFSATGGTSQVVKQISAGGAFTVGRLICADLSNAGAGCAGTLPAGANPSATTGLTAVNGTAGTYMTSDSAPALSQAISPTWTGAHTFSGNSVTLSGNQSRSAWTTTGTGLVQAAATYTDTSTAASGTVATSYINRLGVPTIAASNTGVTYANAYNAWFEPPIAGTNVAITNAYAAGFNGNIQLALDGSRIVGAGGQQIQLNQNNSVAFYQGGTNRQEADNNGNFLLGTNGGFKWTGAASPSNGSYDTGITRDAANAIDIGNGAQGDKTGTINLTTLTALGTVAAYSGTAVPAGGATGKGITMSATANLGVFFGTGAPTLSAAQGSLYIRTDGSTTSTRLYVNTNGSTSWTTFTSAS